MPGRVLPLFSMKMHNCGKAGGVRIAPLLMVNRFITDRIDHPRLAAAR